MPRVAADPVARFWSKVNRAGPEPVHVPGIGGCWLWTGAPVTGGSAQFSVRRKLHIVSRYSWELAHGPIPDGMCVLHRCDNRLCVRPDHLFLGTQGDNMRDMRAKNRQRGNALTHCPQGHLYSGDNLYITPRGHRICKRCRADGMARAKQRHET